MYDCRPDRFQKEDGWRMPRDCNEKCKFWEICQKELAEERFADLFQNQGYDTKRGTSIESLYNC